MAHVLKVFHSKRMLVILLLGFSSGLPIALIGGTLQAWLTDFKVDLKTVGLFSSVMIPYSFKFLWSPLMDRYSLPFLGRRRGWILLTQLMLMAIIAAMGVLDPAKSITLIACLALAVGFMSASQDIVIDAYRVEVLNKEELGAGAAIAIFGYRLAMLTSGAVALILSDHISWSAVYTLMAGLLLVGVLACVICEESSENIKPPRSLGEAVVAPLFDFLRRRGALEVLLFIILYKIGDVLAAILNTRFMLDIGFSRSEIGAVGKTVGLIAIILGGLIGGAIMSRLDMRRSLFYFGVPQALSILSFAVLALVGNNFTVMAVAVGLENLCSGIGTAALLAFIMGICNKRYTATQYALLTSIQALVRSFSGAPAASLVDSYGWAEFFLFCTASAVPGLILLLWRYEIWRKSFALGVSEENSKG